VKATCYLIIIIFFPSVAYAEAPDNYARYWNSFSQDARLAYLDGGIRILQLASEHVKYLILGSKRFLSVAQTVGEASFQMA